MGRRRSITIRQEKTPEVVGAGKQAELQIAEPPPSKRQCVEKKLKNVKVPGEEENLDASRESTSSSVIVAEMIPSPMVKLQDKEVKVKSEPDNEETTVKIGAPLQDQPSTSAAAAMPVSIDVRPISTDGMVVFRDVGTTSSCLPASVHNCMAVVLRNITWEQPPWSDMFRGILITLMERYHMEYACDRLEDEVYIVARNMEKFKAVAKILSSNGTDVTPLISASIAIKIDCSPFILEFDLQKEDFIIIEKWAWLIEMGHRYIVVRNSGRSSLIWRFSNAMSFVNLEVNPFIGTLAEERFIELCETFENTMEDKIVLAEYTAMNRKQNSTGPDLAASEVNEILNRMKPSTSRVQVLPLGSSKIVVPGNLTHLVTEFTEACALGQKQSEWTPQLILSLIKLVEGLPALWNPSNHLFRSITQKRDSWATISSDLRSENPTKTITDDMCQERFTLIKNSFLRCYKRTVEPYFETGQKSAFHALKFLLDKPTTSPPHETEKSPTSERTSPHGNTSRSQTPRDSNCSPSTSRQQPQPVKVVPYDGRPLGPNERVVQYVSNGVGNLVLVSGDGSSFISVDNATNYRADQPATSKAGHEESVWVPPKESDISVPSTSPSQPVTATAQLMVKPLEFQHLQQLHLPAGSLLAPPRKTPIRQLLANQLPATQPGEDKWALLGRLIAQEARELEHRRGFNAALGFQKELNDLIIKYYTQRQ